MVNGGVPVDKVTDPNVVYKGLATRRHRRAAGCTRRTSAPERSTCSTASSCPWCGPARSSTAGSSGYAPFNVQALDGRIYVAYAKQDAEKKDEVAGPGKGYVDSYTTDGRLSSRLFFHSQLNAPWGLAIAPHDLVASAARCSSATSATVASAFETHTGFPLGTVRDPRHARS